MTEENSKNMAVQHWWMQRVTSIALVPLCLYLVYRSRHFLPLPLDYNSLILIIADPFVAMAMILTAVITCYHACLGVEVIIEDYVHGGLRHFLLLLNKSFFLLAGLGASAAVIYIANVLYKGMIE